MTRGAPNSTTFAAREGRHPRTRRDRRPTPQAAHGRTARLHADRPRRAHPPCRHLRRAIPADRLQPHVGKRRGVAVRRLHEPHVAVGPAGLPGQLRRPIRHRHQRADRGGTGLSSDKVGNKMDWYSSSESSFGTDVDAAPGQGFAVNVFIRDGDTVYRTWHTNGRGTEQLTLTFALVDILPWGRQEDWQDSPDGWPKSPAYSNWLDSPDVARALRPERRPEVTTTDRRALRRHPHHLRHPGRDFRGARRPGPP